MSTRASVAAHDAALLLFVALAVAHTWPLATGVSLYRVIGAGSNHSTR